MTIKEMQKQIESMMPTPKQIVENIDKKHNDKQLLLKDLCCRLPYWTIIQVKDWALLDTTLKIGHIAQLLNNNIELKPYLRSMSSMTEEEQKEFDSLWNEGFSKALDAQISGDEAMVKSLEINASSDAIDWLLKNHFDYCGLIPKGLAILVTKDNNPYKDDI